MNKITVFPFCFIALLVGCASQRTNTTGEIDRRDGQSIITIETDRMGEVFFLLAGYRDAVIDWGDGSAPETVKLIVQPYNLSEIYGKDDWKVSHVYTKPGTKRIKVSGNITTIFPKGVEPPIPIDERRRMFAEAEKINPNIKGVAIDTDETLAYNGRSFPILGYARIEDGERTLVTIPIEYTTAFCDYSGGSLSREISGKVTINTGKYAGTWNAWFIYTVESWAAKRVNIYTDAPWKD